MESWDDLRILNVLARAGSLAAAGRALGVNHATVSRRIASLERSLGVSLIVRLPRSTPLTAQGEAVAALAGDMWDTVEAITRTARVLSSGLTGTVTISLPPSLASEFVGPRLAGFAALHPHLTVTLKATAGVSSLERGEADIALRLARPTGPAQVVRRLGVVRMGLYGSQAVVEARPDDWSFIMADRDLAEVPHQAWLARFAGGRPVALRSNDILAQAAAARAGLGVAMLPRFMTTTGGLVPADPTAPPLIRPLWLVTHAGLRKAPVVHAMVEWLSEIFADSPEFAPPAGFDWDAPLVDPPAFQTGAR